MGKSLLYAGSYPATSKIEIVIPTVGQILEDEDAYYGLISMITATPYDYMVQLDDLGIDFTEISSFELFLLLFHAMQSMNTDLVFKNLELQNFKTAINEQNGTLVLVDEEHDITIDKAVHDQIARMLRQINHLEKNDKRPGNKEAMKFMIERARIKQKRAARKKRGSQLEDLIVAMVNTEQYKYDYQTTLGLTIYQFNKCVHQIVKKINYDNTMIGCYAGTVNAKELDQNDLNWLITK